MGYLNAKVGSKRISNKKVGMLGFDKRNKKEATEETLIEFLEINKRFIPSAYFKKKT